MGIQKRLYEARSFSPGHQSSGPQPETRKMAATLVDLATGTTSAQRKASQHRYPPRKPPMRPGDQLTMWDI